MPRDNYNDIIISVDTDGAPTVLLEGVLVTVYLAGTTTLATIYVARTGSAQITNPFEAPSGKVNLWADSGEYDFLYHDMTTPVRIADQVFGWEAISAAPEGVPGTLVARSSLTSDRAAADLLNMLIPTGTVLSFAGSTAPLGFSICNGASLLRSAFPALFAVIGTTYGSADSTHFNLPDLLGRVAVGAGNGAGLSARPLAAKLGNEVVALTTAQMPAHAHGVNDGGHGHGVSDPTHSHGLPGSVTPANHNLGAYKNVQTPPSGGGQSIVGYGGSDLTMGTGFSGTFGAGTGIAIVGSGTGISIQNNGSGGMHDNMMPYTALNAIIRNGT